MGRPSQVVKTAIGSIMSSPEVLSPSLRATLAEVGDCLKRGRPFELGLSAKLDELHELAPSAVVRAEREIVEVAELFHRREGSLPWRRSNDLKSLARVEGLEYVLVFHRNGYVREAALRKIAGGLPSAFAFASIAWRLNDWVEPVRAAAVECAARSFGCTAPEVVARAALVLLVRETSWGRWGAEKAAFEDALDRPEVSEKLFQVIVRQTTGPTAKALRFALRKPRLDGYLVEIASQAKQPEVRALAAKTLIEGAATWSSGWRYRWIDKSMGIRRPEPIIAQRSIAGSPDRDGIVAACARDKAAAVRNLAVASLISFSLGTDRARTLAATLTQDRSRAVRERAEFILRQA